MFLYQGWYIMKGKHILKLMSEKFKFDGDVQTPAWSRVQRKEQGHVEHVTFNIAHGHVYLWRELIVWHCVEWQCQVMRGASWVFATANPFSSQSSPCNYLKVYSFTLTKTTSTLASKLSIEFIYLPLVWHSCPPSVPSDSDEESRWQPALALTFNLLASKVFEDCFLQWKSRAIG